MIGLSEAIKRVDAYQFDYDSITKSDMAEAAKSIDASRRWSNNQIQRLADAMKMSEAQSDKIIDAAIDLLADKPQWVCLIHGYKALPICGLCVSQKQEEKK